MRAETVCSDTLLISARHDLAMDCGCIAIDDPVQKAIGHTPLLIARDERDGFIVEADDPAVALALFTVMNSTISPTATS